MLFKHLMVVLAATEFVVGRPTGRNVWSAIHSLSDDELTALEVMLGIEEAASAAATSDEEEMQGDQPLPGNETTLDPIKSRDREQRIKEIMRQVLQFAGRDLTKTNSTSLSSNRKQTDTFDKVYNEMKKIKYNDLITEKVQNFYPACELPRNTDAELWEGGQAMKLHFDLPFPVPAPGSTVQIQYAKLRLFKVFQTLPGVEEKREFPHVQRYSSGSPLEPEERKIRVSAYWYTRSLKRNRVKRKLLDSMMLPLYVEEWMEFNVKPAANSWKESGKNFGLAVEVENEDGILLQASKYFVAMNCSKEAGPVRSMPGFLIDTFQNNRTAAKAAGVYFYPSIELSTIEFPESTVGSSYGVVKYPLENLHRLRHNHHVPIYTTPANDSLEPIAWDDPTDR